MLHYTAEGHLVSSETMIYLAFTKLFLLCLMVLLTLDHSVELSFDGKGRLWENSETLSSSMYVVLLFSALR